MNLQIIFLGTAGSIPTAKRALPAIAVKRKNELLLFDCGEGAQRQMVRAKVAFHKAGKIFISHMHGDHVLGLPGLIQTMSLLNRRDELEIYGPVGIKAFIEAVNRTVQFTLTFPITVMEIRRAGVVCREEEYEVHAAEADHLVPALVYSLIEKPRPGRFNQEKAKALGIPKGPLWSRLQHGESIRLPNNRVVKPKDVLGKPRLGRKIVYTGDTRPTKALVKLAQNADLLIHEATFGDELKDRAMEDGHSTPGDVARIAKDAKVKRLVLTHISARYASPEPLLKQARKIFRKTDVAEDFMRVSIPLGE